MRHKPLNAIISALSEDNARDAILRLQREGYINVVEWLGVDKGQGVITHDYGNLLDVKTLREYYSACPPDIYDKIYRRLYIFLDMVYRNGDRPIAEYVNAFNLWVGYYYGLLNSKKIDLVIFGDVPHFGVDSIAKDVADAMGITTLLFHQVYQDNRFFAFTNIEDIGIYDSVPNSSNSFVKLDGNYEKELWRLSKDDYASGNKKKKTANPINLIKKIVKYRCCLKRKIFGYFLQKLQDFSKKYEEILYQENISKVTKENLNLDVDYVYFPLHLQPEMTTSAFGKEYCDQILAIERVSEMIPPTWRIYVKEYPIQSAYMRGDLFFKRLALLPKVQFIGGENNTYGNTYDLIRHSRFVATITGTAGWEAISGGKPALVFGLAWYRKLPGVFEYANNPKLEDILQCKINYKEVEVAYNRLMEKAYVGILECGWETRLKDYSPEKNNELLFAAFTRMINKLQQKEMCNLE